MAIYRKGLIGKRLNELETFYLGLREALQGREPSTFSAKAYGETKEDFVRDYTEVDLNDVLVRLEHFKAEITAIKLLKGDQVKPKRQW